MGGLPDSFAGFDIAGLKAGAVNAAEGNPFAKGSTFAGYNLYDIGERNRAIQNERKAAYGLPGFDARAANTQSFADSRGGGQFQQQQGELANMLLAQAQGKDSISAEQLRQNMGRLMSQQQAFAASARPSMAAMASRQAMQNASNIGAGLAGQQALAGIAERNAAANSLAGVLGTGRGQDISAWQAGQNLNLQNAIAQQGGQIGLQQANDARRAGQTSDMDKLFGVGKGALDLYLMTYGVPPGTTDKALSHGK